MVKKKMKKTKEEGVNITAVAAEATADVLTPSIPSEPKMEEGPAIIPNVVVDFTEAPKEPEIIKVEEETPKSDMQTLILAMIERLRDARIAVNPKVKVKDGSRVVIKKEYYDCDAMFPVLVKDGVHNLAVRMDLIVEKGRDTNSMAQLAKLKRDVNDALRKEPFAVRNFKVTSVGMTSASTDDSIETFARVSRVTQRLQAKKN